MTVTGVLLAGAACFWREILGLFGGLYREFTDEARTIERRVSRCHGAGGLRPVSL